MHISVIESVLVPFLFLHHLHPGTFSGVGLHALKVTLLILNLWCFCISCQTPCKPLAAVESCEGFTSMRDTAFELKNC
jgi:hypothetical protein